VIALENAVYSVISPEGCASILWRTAEEAPTAAAAMRMTAAEQQALGVIDTVVEEPGEGAHTDHAETARRLKPIIVAELDRLSRLSLGELLEARYHRFRDLGPYTELDTEPTQPVERQGIADRLRNIFDPGRWPASPGRDDPPARDEV
jgi:acetyl-CoA carboxylase carboxyl transferase subunit alpha